MSARVWTAAIAAVGLAALAACGGGGGGGGAAKTDTLVIDTAFLLKTVDPARQYETTSGIIDHALYDTLLTFDGGDATTPKPLVAQRYEASPDGKTFTFTLRDDVTFADGTKLTAKDVVYSFNRVTNIKGSSAFLLDGVTTTAPDDKTVVLTSATPNPGLPFMVSSPTLSIVNSAAVAKAGGNDQPGADQADKAETSLNKTSMGSGPYELESFDVQSEVVLKARPNYWGPTKPTYQRVVIRNTDAAVQKVNVQKGDAQIALDLSADQAAGLASDRVKVDTVPSPTLFYLTVNANPAVSSTSSNKDILEAIRYGIDYAGLVQLGGTGSIQAPGVVPQGFLGALPADKAVKRDVERAKAAVARSGIANPTIKMSYPSDLPVAGISHGDLAARVQANLREVGITVNLAPAPSTTALDAFRAGTEQAALWFWNPDFPDPSNYLAFLPGATLGKRAGWPATADPALTSLGEKATAETDNAARGGVYQQIQEQLNERGPFLPLFHPSQVVAYASTVKGVAYHPSWTIDVADLN
jgi:peptide/nickel transport system substrate-binding protein